MNYDIQSGSMLVFRGRREDAVYRDPGITEYCQNPLIEALPPIFDEETAMALLSSNAPSFIAADRGKPGHLRFHLIQLALRLFVPLDAHIELEQKFSSMIRIAYQARNPIKPHQWHEMHRRANLVGKDIPVQPNFRAMSNGFFMLGISGGGKTTAVEKVLQLYPQIIDHSEYGGLRFTSRQLVWLKLDCPFDGSIRGLCINFFQAIDDLLGTRYYEAYGSGRRTTDEMLPHMALVASLHHIGVLVIDEIQHLSHAKGGGGDQMLSFFVQLINAIGLPVVLVGTYKAIGLLRGEFRQARRGSGQGDVVWERMREDETWRFFLESLFDYQYVRNPVPLTPELADAFYRVTQGITDFAAKVFMLSQIRAIASGQEMITTSIIESVANDSLRLAKPVLDALRDGNLRDLSAVADVQPIDFEKAFKNQRDARRNSAVVQTPLPETSEQATNPPQQSADLVGETSDQGEKPKAKRLPSSHSAARVSHKNGVVAIAEAGQKKGVGPHQALLQAGLILPASEYLVA